MKLPNLMLENPVLRRTLACVFLLGSALGSGPLSAQIVNVPVPLDAEMLKANGNFGYTPEDIQKLFGAPEIFTYDYTGFARELVKAPPAPGVHPRVLFYAEDLPALREKFVQTKPGKLAMDGIRAALTELITGPKAKFAKVYEDAANGVESPDLTNVEPACAIVCETFRALIDDDYQKDTAPHTYDWGMILEDDVTQVSKSDTDTDTVLGEGKTGPDARFLLVRVLNAEGRDPATPAIVKYDLPNPPQKPISMNRLRIYLLGRI